MADEGSAFARAVSSKDRGGLLEVLADDVDFRALTPGRAWEASSPPEVADIVFGSWFEPQDDIVGLVGVEDGDPVGTPGGSPTGSPCGPPAASSRWSSRPTTAPGRDGSPTCASSAPACARPAASPTSTSDPGATVPTRGPLSATATATP